MPGTVVAQEVAAPSSRAVRQAFSDRRVRLVLGCAAVAALYRAAAEVGYALQFAGPVAAIVWLPIGVGIAALYLYGLRFWPGVLLGDLVANDYGTLPVGSAIGQTAGNLLEIVVATLILRRLVPRRDPLGSVAGVAGMVAAITAGTAVSASVGSASLWLGDVIASAEVARVWRTWWLGDASGALIVVPLALAWARPFPRPPLRRVAEAAAVLALVVVLSAVALRRTDAVTYLVFPALMWAALRTGRRGATLAVAVAAAFAIFETTHREGPFALDSITASVLATQLYIAAAAFSTLCLAASVAERRAFARRLSDSRQRLVEAGATERRRVERDLHDGVQQRLTALLVRLNLAVEGGEMHPRALARLQAAGDELSEAIDELREIAHGIHPSVVTDGGLADALRGMAAASPLPLRLLELPATRVDPVAEVTAYYVIAETLTNARKHSGATRVELRVRAGSTGLHVDIADDGRGGAYESAGSGIQGLRDRVEAMGGTLELHSAAGCGTRIVADLPASPLAAV
jgi:two-component system, NarL family, sensor histidine kinase FusK